MKKGHGQQQLPTVTGIVNSEGRDGEEEPEKLLDHKFKTTEPPVELMVQLLIHTHLHNFPRTF